MGVRRCLAGLLMTIVLCPVLVQAADQIAPSDRVETGVRIRAAPTTNSAIIGSLLPGQQRPLRSSAARWYEIALPNGASGFVSKSWTQRIPESPVALVASKLRLGEWNLRKLGHGTAKNYALVAEAIESNFDILALLEVMQKAGGHPGYDQLIGHLGSEWTGVITDSPRPNNTSGNAEFYAVVFRSSRVRQCDGWNGLRFLPDNDGSDGATGPDLFSREPAFGCFVAIRGDGALGFDFLLAAYHARWAEGDITDIQAEVKHLSKVFASMKQAQPGEHDLLVVGDFNLRPTDLAMVVSQEDATAGTGSTLNSAGGRTQNLYDHLIVFDRSATAELAQPASILDVRSLASLNRVFYQTMSDHLPLVARFRVATDDD